MAVNVEFHGFYDEMMKNPGFVKDETLGEILEMSYEVNESMDRFKKELAESVLKIDVETESLKETIERYGKYANGIRGFMKKFAEERVKLAKVLKENAEGKVMHVDKRVDYETLPLVFPKFEIYILFFSETLIKKMPKAWQENWAHFSSLVGCQGSKMKIFIVDYELHERIKKQIIKISYYDRQKKINDDFLAENR